MVEMIKESDDSIGYILNESNHTVDELKDVNKLMKDLESNVKNVYNVVDSIKGNTARTKMLALNASIEAARAGEEGKGFKIVANEMGKLSQMSAESVSNINESLAVMSKSIKDITESISTINTSAFNNLESIEKISNNLSEVLEKFNKLAK